MRSVTPVRRMLHRRYVRAAAVGCSLVLVAGSFGVLALRLHHGVSAAAVTRFFTRVHLDEADLTPLVRHRETGAQLEAILRSGDARELGGIVYAEGGRLTFHPHTEAGLQRRWRSERENRALYSRLVPIYHRADVSELLAVLSSPAIKTELSARGVDVSGLAGLVAELEAAMEPEEKIRVLRLAARFIQPFEPHPLSPPWLGLGDRLRFYESAPPAGRFVGQYALLDPAWGAALDEREALEMSRRSHYLLITAVAERILLLDFYRGRVHRFDLRPFDHSIGHRLYRVAVAG